MAVTPRCPSCRFDITPDIASDLASGSAPSGSGHPSSAGSVRYLRCVCGLWLVAQDGEVIATAGVSDLAAPADLPDLAEH
jgi:hypothetical protein